MIHNDPMKALPAFFSASLLLAAPLFAEDAPPAPAPAAASDAKPAEAAKSADSQADLPVQFRQTQIAPAPAATPAPVPPLFPTPGEVPTAPSTKLSRDTQTTFVKPPSMITKKEKPSRTEDAENDLLQQIHFREARTKAMADPAVVAALAKAHAAPTDYEQREGVKHYYALLFDRMAKIDNSFPTLIAEARRVAMTRETQSKLQPTVRPDWLPPLPPAQKTAASH